MNPDKQQAELLKQTQKQYFRAVFGTAYIAHAVAIFMLAVSLILAVFVPHDGLFATASSAGMSNYHRWLYNAALIGVFYYAIFCLYVRLFAVTEVDRQYKLLHVQAERALRKALEKDEQQVAEDV
jgi:NADH:ubiquinone oxidoreductase subunit 5 (subunit L)/multisubunit Na+/H+ antiporter MnhA subunit